jgi:hypothetical protein
LQVAAGHGRVGQRNRQRRRHRAVAVADRRPRVRAALSVFWFRCSH